jgi:NAD(P)-dependent dehydrogenase (short-subunit alcohol dehydrogenase family)
LAGQVALVTGGGREIGRAISLALAGAGADVAIGYRSDAARAGATAEAVRGLGRRACTVGGDLVRRVDAERVVSEVVLGLGRLDLLVINAGARGRGALETLDEADWDAVVAVNLKAAFLIATAAGRHMMGQGGGAIVTIAGASAHRSYPGAGAYGPSKAALVSLTKQMALEWAGHGIRVNGVSPGPIREAGSGWEADEPGLVRQAARIPLRRVGTPEDVAGAVVYLASPAAAYVTGHMLLVDGGSAETWYITP